MRVVLNQHAAFGRRTGIGHYTSQLLSCLHQLTEPGEIDARPGAWLNGLRHLFARQGRPAAPSPGTVPRRRKGLKARAAALLRPCGRALLRLYFRRVFRGGRYDLYHEPNFIPVPCDLPTVATVHDLSVLLHPEWHPADRVAYFEKHFHQGLGQCVHYFAISESARIEISTVLNIPLERITRTYMGIRPGLRPLSESEVAPVRRELGLPNDYLLYLGTIEPRKNVLTLLRAYCDLPAPLRERCPLVLAGGWGWRTEEIAAYYDAHAQHRGVLHLGYVPERCVPALYNGARALVFPSLYEGFGLPPVEMLACGGAVLASTAAAVAETAGPRAHLTEPHNLQGWRDALYRVITDDDWRDQLRRDVAAFARPFTWQRCAEDTLRVYRALCGAGGMVESVPVTQPIRRAG
jgi:glycosyltransferase involved in cell wall biosynthesis